jgi:uncharacterized membrane protein
MGLKMSEERDRTQDIKPERILSIDVMRGFALICMVLVHFMIFYGNAGAANTWPFFILNHGLGDWGAACFLMMMGMSQVFSGEKHKEEGNLILFKRALIRGCFIFMAGIIMLALAWGPYQIWQWDILTLIGFATIMLFFCVSCPPGLSWRSSPPWLFALPGYVGESTSMRCGEGSSSPCQ